MMCNNHIQDNLLDNVCLVRFLADECARKHNCPDHVMAMGHTKQGSWYQYHEDMKINFLSSRLLLV